MQEGRERGWFEGTADLSAVTAAEWHLGTYERLHSLLLDPAFGSCLPTIAANCSLHENRTAGILQELLGNPGELYFLAWYCDEGRVLPVADAETLDRKLFCTSYDVRSPGALAPLQKGCNFTTPHG